MMRLLAPFALFAILLPGCTTVRQDEAAVRAYYESWMGAMREGDTAAIRELIAEDAQYFAPGAPGPMGKEMVAVAVTASAPNIEFHLDSDVREIRVIGDHAWLLTEFELWIVDERPELEEPTKTRMIGHTLTILERTSNGWVAVRDMNTTTPAPPQ